VAFPRIYAGRRRGLLWRLVANGAVQAVLAFGLAHLLRAGIGSATAGTLDLAVVGGLAAAGLALLGLRAVEAADAERLGQEYVMDVRLRILGRIAAGPDRATGRRRWGVQMTRMISDLNALRNWVSVGIARAVVASITIAGLLAALASFDRRASLAVLAAAVVAVLGAAALTPRLRDHVREARRRRGRLANNLGEKLFAHRTVSQLGRTRSELRRVRSHSRRMQDALVRRVRVGQVLRELPAAALPLALGAWLGLAAWSGQGAADAAVSVLLLGMIAASLGEIARAWDYRLAFEVGRQRIGQVLAGPRVAEARGAVALPDSGPLAVAFDGVSVTDDGSDAPLDLEAAPGDVVLVTGPTGSGKSTLLALAARLLDPARGEVRLAGVPLRRVRLDALRHAVQLVAVELPLLRGTVAENVAYGSPASTEALDEVLRACGLSEPSPLLPRALETRIEEQGHNLPHGLRARIALARAAAMGPRLLLVDDPAFAFDPDAARALRRVVGMLGATTLVVGREDAPPLPPDRVWRLAARHEELRRNEP